MSTDVLYLGYHVSTAGGYLAMAKRAEALGANTFAFFTRNPRGGAAARVEEDDIRAFLAYTQEKKFGKLVAHAPYTLNPCSDKESVREFAEIAFREDLQRLELTPGHYYNFHPGSHVGQGTEKGVGLIAELLNRVLTPEMHTTVLLETMAGKGSEIGGRFEELADILGRVELREKMGVCLDTCHVWDGGYEIAGELDAVLTEFDRVIGLERLCAVHLNNSMNPLGARKDRHAPIRAGQIPEDALCAVVSHPALRGKPFILETPNDDAGYAAEIRYLQTAYRERTAQN